MMKAGATLTGYLTLERAKAAVNAPDYGIIQIKRSDLK